MSSFRSIAKWRTGGFFSVEVLVQKFGLVIAKFSGKEARDAFKDEPGGHRWQRIPPTEKRGRVQSSTVTVAVLNDVPISEFELDLDDVEITTTRGSGPGGQNRNKVESCVVAVHIPTDTRVRVESERSQHQNKQQALELLRLKLFNEKVSREMSERSDLRKSQVGSGMRGDKRRTVRCQDCQVTDHITGKTWRLKEYMRGDL